jgi:trk system potassium uptake protein TrkH
VRAARFIQPLDPAAVWGNLCLILRVVGLIFTVPLAVALATGDWTRALRFAAASGGCLLVGYLGLRRQPKQLRTPEALTVTALSYLLLALLGAALFVPEASFLDGLFESMSGFTTTGLSVLPVDRLPVSLLFFRAYSQWVGGIGIVLLSLLVLVGPGRSAFQLFSSEYGGQNLAGNVQTTARTIGLLYLGLTAAGYAAYRVVGMGWMDALLHVMATVSTGGFSRYRDSIGHYPGPAPSLVVTLFMLLGAVSFTTYLRLLRGEARALVRDRQLLTLVTLVVLYLAVGRIVLGPRGESPWLLAFRGASAATTTGFSAGGPETRSDALVLMGIVLMVAGGSAGSTAGGVKLFRLLLVLKTARYWILKVILPKEAKLSVRVEHRVVSAEDAQMTTAFLGLYLLGLVISALLLAAHGFGLRDSLYEAASALGTVGTSAGITSPTLAPGLKALLVVDMWAGRLEIIPLIVLLYPRMWTRRRNP